MTLTDRVRKEFSSDCILVLDDCIQIYWYADAHGKWFPYDGGPVKGAAAGGAAQRLAERIDKWRELLPRECRDFTIRLGEMTPNGKFTQYRESINAKQNAKSR